MNKISFSQMPYPGLKHNDQLLNGHGSSFIIKPHKIEGSQILTTKARESNGDIKPKEMSVLSDISNTTRNLKPRDSILKPQGSSLTMKDTIKTTDALSGLKSGTEVNNNDIKFSTLSVTNHRELGRTQIKNPLPTIQENNTDYTEDNELCTEQNQETANNSSDQAPGSPPQFVSIRQTKMVLLGDVGAGKTSLLNALRFQEAHLSPEGATGRTIGIEVHSVKLRQDLQLWVYDFGGHDTYHFSHQLFLSQRALYVLTVNIGDYDSTRVGKSLRHWFNILTARLGGPVICVVATHADLVEDPKVLEERLQDIRQQLQRLNDEHLSKIYALMKNMTSQINKSNKGNADLLLDFQSKTLQKPMKQLQDLMDNRPKCNYNINCVSSKTMSGFSDFCNVLVSMVYDNEQLFPGMKLPKSWVDLADDISSKKTEMPFMSYSQFVDLASQYGLQEVQVPGLLRHLQNSGVILHYEDYRKNSALKNYVFSNPNLLLAIFGLVFNHNYYQDEIRFVWKNVAILKLPQFDFEMLRRNLRQKAIIGERLLKCFWDSLGIKEDIFKAILSLLERFDLCYEIPVRREDEMPEGRHFIFPYLLKDKIPAEVSAIWPDQIPDGCVEYQLSLEFPQGEIPFGFQEKVSVRINPYLEQRINWSNGLVAFCSEGLDLVRIEVVHSKNSLLFSTRVQNSRMSMTRHILLLLAAVTNRVLLHYYPGIIALWYVHCAHCITLKRVTSDLIPDKFPADNVVMALAPQRQVTCCNCVPGENLTLADIFPPNTANGNMPRIMSSQNQQALKGNYADLCQQLDIRKLVTRLLRKGLVDVTMAETVLSLPNQEEKCHKLLSLLPLCGDTAFTLMVDVLQSDKETASLGRKLLAHSQGQQLLRSRPQRSKSMSNLGGSADSQKPNTRAFWIVGTRRYGADF